MKLIKVSLFILRKLHGLRFIDRLFCWLQFYQQHGNWPTSQQSFNNELYRLKVSSEILSPLRQFVSDKYLVKHYISSVVGVDKAVETLAYLRTREEIDRYQFPESCVIKPSHATGAVFIRKKNGPINRNLFVSWLKLDLYRSSREANYKYLSPGIIVEPIVFSGAKFNDVKFHCFNGEVKLFQFHFDLVTNNRIVFFDKEKNRLSLSINYPTTDRAVVLPEIIDEMIKCAEQLAADFSIVRIDMLFSGESFLVGEITNVSNSAHGVFSPIDSETEFSRYFFG